MFTVLNNIVLMMSANYIDEWILRKFELPVVHLLLGLVIAHFFLMH